MSGAASYDSTVNGAHTLLAQQKGHELAYEDPFAKLASQASKIVRGLGNIRNDYGSGHGKARQPEIKGEMLALALDGTLLWLRWALRRLDPFAQGRPEGLIRDIIGDSGGGIIFRAGDLADRLKAANLATSDPSHVRAIGLAVGQRAAGGTFNTSPLFRPSTRSASAGPRSPRRLSGSTRPSRMRERPARPGARSVRPQA